MLWLRCLVVAVAVVLATTGAGHPTAPSRAQTTESGLARVSQATVSLVAGESSGSGTLITPTGLILTNYHVVSGARAQGALVEVHVYTGRNSPKQVYRATVVEADRAHDLAVLQIIADGSGTLLDQGQVNLTHLPVGDSSQLEIGDELYIAGYPSIGGDDLTITQGIVSGFEDDDQIGPEAWIKTDAVIAVGSSGGAVTNRAGQLLAITTRVTQIECREGDTNDDGVIDEGDAECVLTGGTVGLLRPIDLAKPLLLEVNPEFRFEATQRQSGETPPATEQTVDELTDDQSNSSVTHTPTPNAEREGGIPFPGDGPTPAATETLPPIGTEAVALLPDSLRFSSGHSLLHYDAGELPGLFVYISLAAQGEFQAPDSFGWEENAYRIYAVDVPPRNSAGWLELSVDRFSTVDGAREALDYLAGVRETKPGHDYVELAPIADETVMLSGPGYNGWEVTLFARHGDLVLRATGISPDGDPTKDVLEAMLMLLDQQ